MSASFASSETEIDRLRQAVDAADSATGLQEAVEALAAAEHPAAIPTLIAVLGFNNPGAAVAATDGLVGLGSVAVEPLLGNIDGYNYGARAWATRALAAIGDPCALDVLIEAATTDFAASVRRAAVRGLGALQWDSLPVEDRMNAQDRALSVLHDALNDGEWVVRYAAIVGLQVLASTIASERPEPYGAIERALAMVSKNDTDLVVRLRSLQALEVDQQSLS